MATLPISILGVGILFTGGLTTLSWTLILHA
jgi:hypothetical protein